MSDSVDPHVVKLRDDAAGWRRVNGPTLTPADPFLTGLPEQKADALVNSQWALVHSDVDAAREHRFGTDVAPFDPGEYTVDELRDALADGDYSSDELAAIADAEAGGKDRETAHDAINAARGDS